MRIQFTQLLSVLAALGLETIHLEIMELILYLMLLLQLAAAAVVAQPQAVLLEKVAGRVVVVNQAVTAQTAVRETHHLQVQVKEITAVALQRLVEVTPLAAAVVLAQSVALPQQTHQRVVRVVLVLRQA
jgi:hypothetical protein